MAKKKLLFFTFRVLSSFGGAGVLKKMRVKEFFRKKSFAVSKVCITFAPAYKVNGPFEDVSREPMMAG